MKRTLTPFDHLPLVELPHESGSEVCVLVRLSVPSSFIQYHRHFRLPVGIQFSNAFDSKSLNGQNHFALGCSLSGMRPASSMATLRTKLSSVFTLAPSSGAASCSLKLGRPAPILSARLHSCAPLTLRTSLATEGGASSTHSASQRLDKAAAAFLSRPRSQCSLSHNGWVMGHLTRPDGGTWRGSLLEPNAAPGKLPGECRAKTIRSNDASSQAEGDPADRDGLLLCGCTPEMHNVQYRGVQETPTGFRSRMRVRKLSKRLGKFPCNLAAARAYDVASRAARGIDAKLANFPQWHRNYAQHISELLSEWVTPELEWNEMAPHEAERRTAAPAAAASLSDAIKPSPFADSLRALTFPCSTDLAPPAGSLPPASNERAPKKRWGRRPAAALSAAVAPAPLLDSPTAVNPPSADLAPPAGSLPPAPDKSARAESPKEQPKKAARRKTSGTKSQKGQKAWHRIWGGSCWRHSREQGQRGQQRGRRGFVGP